MRIILKHVHQILPRLNEVVLARGGDLGIENNTEDCWKCGGITQNNWRRGARNVVSQRPQMTLGLEIFNVVNFPHGQFWASASVIVIVIVATTVVVAAERRITFQTKADFH